MPNKIDVVNLSLNSNVVGCRAYILLQHKFDNLNRANKIDVVYSNVVGCRAYILMQYIYIYIYIRTNKTRQLRISERQSEPGLFRNSPTIAIKPWIGFWFFFILSID
jgi:hypothetical protein